MIVINLFVYLVKKNPKDYSENSHISVLCEKQGIWVIFWEGLGSHK